MNISDHSLSRRTFLTGVTAGAAIASLPLGRKLTAQTRPVPPAVPSLARSSKVTEMSATHMVSLIKSGRLTATEAVKACIAQIEKVNPQINAVVTTCYDRALREAAQLDARQAAGGELGPLHGVPFTIKDSLMTSGVRSTFGTKGREHHVPGEDATVVARLRAAGAILLGKTNTPEFTLGGGGRGTWNHIFGQTFNPYNRQHTPRGSSGGAAAIVAAGGVPFDIGSDFGGSIRGPAHACGIAGIKPTFGSVPRTGHMPGYGGPWDSYQELGPMCRWAEDMELVLKVIWGPDDIDAAMCPIDLESASNINFDGMRVAFYTDNQVVTPTPETIQAVNRTVDAFRRQGARVVEAFHGGDAEVIDYRGKLLGADGGAWRQRLLNLHGTTLPTPGFAGGITGNELPSAEFTRLMEVQDDLRTRMLQWMENFDLVICPVNAYPAPSLLNPVTPQAGYTSIYNVTGWPGSVVRMGTSPEGLPINVQFVAQPWKDHLTLAAAVFAERVSGGWSQPGIF
jgi:amidase